MNTEFDDLPSADEGHEPQAANENTAPDDGPGLDDGSHLDQFRAPDIEGESQAAPDDVQPVDDEGQPITPDAEPGQITKGQFWEVFKQVFSLPGLFQPIWKPLAIQPDETEQARAASDAIYEIAEIYLPSLLRPGGEMAGRLLACVPFLMAKAQIARGIMAEMKAQRIAAAQPANVNAAPAEGDGAVFRSSRGQPGDELREMMDEAEAA